jgi:hypothetical protein
VSFGDRAEMNSTSVPSGDQRGVLGDHSSAISMRARALASVGAIQTDGTRWFCALSTRDTT